MAQVPVQFVPRARARAASLTPASTSTPRGAFGGGVARATQGFGQQLGQVGDQLGAIAIQMAEEDNETKAKEADARMADRIRAIMMGDPDGADGGTPGFMNTRGNTTLNTFGDAEKALRAAVEQEVNGATNPHMTQLITSAGKRRLEVALDRMTGHAAEQRLVTQDNASVAREAAAFSDVSADWQSDAVLQQALGVVAAEVQDRAERRGMGADEAAALLQERQSVIVKGGFDAALAGGDVARAQAIFSQNADRLSGATRTTMAQALAQDVQLETGQSLAQEAWAMFPNDPAAARKFIRDSVDGQQESVAIAEYRTLLEEWRGDTRFARSMQEAAEDDAAEARAIASAARAEVNHNYALQERARQESERAAAADAYRAIDNGMSVSEWRRANPEQYDVLSAAGRIDNLIVTERNIKEGRTYATSSDGETLANIRLMPYEERARMTEGDLLAVRSSMTEEEFRQAQTAIASAKRKVRSDTRDRAVYSAGEQALNSFATNGFRMDGGSTKEQVASSTARYAMEQWVSERIEAGDYPTQPEINEFAAVQMMNIQAGAGWFDGVDSWHGLAAQKKEMSQEQRAVAIVPRASIPPTVLDALNEMVSVNWTGVAFEDLEEEALEELAGALAMGDESRMNRIIREAGGKRVK